MQEDSPTETKNNEKPSHVLRCEADRDTYKATRDRMEEC